MSDSAQKPVAPVARAFLLGLREWRSCALHGVGMTWDVDDGENEAYDRGVNVGVALHNIRVRVRRALSWPWRWATKEREVLL